MRVELSKMEFFESGMALCAARLGVMSPAFLAKFDTYKIYLDFLSKANGVNESRKTTALRDTIDKTGLGYSYVYRCVQWFEDGLQNSGKQKVGELTTFNRSKDKSNGSPV